MLHGVNRIRMYDWSPQPDRFEAGDRVRITDGTFAGQEGTILSSDEARASGLFNPPPSLSGKLFFVKLIIFGRDVPVQLEAFQIVRLE